MALPVLNRATHPDLLTLTSTAILGAEKPLLKRMALTYLAGDFGDLVDLHNSENNYPACAGVSYELGLGVLSIIYFDEKPKTVEVPPGIARFFQKMGQSTQVRYKDVRAVVSLEVESVTLLTQEMLENRFSRIGWLAGKAAGKKGEAVFAIKFSDTTYDELARGKKLVVHASAKEYEVLARVSSSKRLSELEKLVSMKEKGLLSEEEFTAAKAKLLGL